MTTSPRSLGDPGVPLLLWEVQQTARVAARRFEQAMQAAGISTAEYGILACVNDEPGLTQADVARQLQVRPQALTSTLQKLRRRGFVAGALAGRGRRSRLCLTDEGRTALDDAWPHVLALNAPDNLGLTRPAAVELGVQLAGLRRRLGGAENEHDRLRQT